MRTQRFGIEIELTGITREDAAKVIAEYFGTESYYIGTYYKTYGAKDRKGREWKAIFDSSIVAQKKVHRQVISAGDEYKCEIVSPILTYDDIPDLQEVIRQLRHKGAFASEKCGIHIHVDASRYTPQTLRIQQHHPCRGDQGIHPVLPCGQPSGTDTEIRIPKADGDGQ